MEISGHCAHSVEEQFRKANALSSRALLQRLKEVHGSPVPSPEPDIVDIVPIVVRNSGAPETKAEARFIRYRTDENGVRIPTVSEIKLLVSKYFDITVVNLDSRSRKVKYVWPRQIGMFLSSTITLRSLPDIGRRFGGRDHTTVLHAVRKIERLVRDKPEIADLIDDLKEELNDDGGAAVSSNEIAASAHQAPV